MGTRHIAPSRLIGVSVVLALALLLSATAVAQPYRHTIVIDGFDDFTSGETFQTTTAGITAYFTWDDTHLYLGCTGSLPVSSVYDYIAVYLDADPDAHIGATTGILLGSQQPAFPADFRPDHAFLIPFDYSSGSFWTYGGSWAPDTYNVVHGTGSTYFEAAIPLADLGDPTELGATFSIIHTADFFESTYAGVPDDIYVDSLDPDFVNHLAFDFGSEHDPNYVPPPRYVVIDPVPSDATWILDGPSSFNVVGVGDSTFVDLELGDYTVTWVPLIGWLTPATEQQTLTDGATITFTGDYVAAPVLTEVGDVPDDQGGRVRLVWTRVAHDAPGAMYQVTGYEVYRRQATSGDKLAGWDYLATAPAHGDYSYQYVAETLCDSTAAGRCWTTFMLRAVTYDPFLYFDSPPDSGNSADNLAPSVPTGLVSGGDVLSWDDPVDADFRHFTVYGSESSVFDGTAVLVDHTTGTSFDIGAHPHAYYHLTATDFAGNEGGAATLSNLTGADDAIPSRNALHPCVPNPFNPSTTIAYETARNGHVEIAVYSLSGQVVRTLVGEVLPAGSHTVRWDGMDDAGQRAASGVYLCRLKTGGHVESRRMVLLK